MISLKTLRRCAWVVVACLLCRLTAGGQGTWSADGFRALLRQSDVDPVWIPSSDRYWYLTQSAAGKRQFVMVDAVSGEKQVTADPGQLNLTVDVEPRTSQLLPPRTHRSSSSDVVCSLEFVNQTPEPVQLHWVSQSGQRILYATIPAGKSHLSSTYQGHLWDVETAGEKRLARIVASPLVSRILIDGPSPELPPSAREAGLSRQRIGVSPDGKWRATPDGKKIRLTQLADGQTQSLTANINQAARYFGPVAWSPHSNAFIVSATVPVETRQLTLVQSSPPNEVHPRLQTFDYAKPGDDLPQPVPVLFRLRGNQFEPVVIDAASFPEQFNTSSRHDYHWAPDGSEVYFDVNDRGHQRYRVLAVNRDSGQLRTVVEETSSTFLHYRKFAERRWLWAARQLLWCSERSGWNHLWRIDLTGQQAPAAVTSGEWVVREILKVDEAAETVWFTASGLRKDEDPYHVHLCRVQLDGSDFRQLTEGDGTHEIEFTVDETAFFDRWSRVDMAPVTELRRATDGSLIAALEAGQTPDFTRFGPLPEHFHAPGRDGQTGIYGVIVKPSNFDPARKYPVVEQVYAGPHASFTPRQFGAHAGLQEIAELGFIVVQADGMGTDHRGKKFHDVCWKNLKDAGFPDRIAWLRAAAATRPWMDLSRVGIYGGSAGGQTAMRALLDHADFYHVAVADCGCHDNRVDKLWWNEQWLGWPLDDSYARNSNVVDAHKLNGQLLLIVGELDHNVDPACTWQVVHALQAAGKSCEVAPIINAGHGAAQTPAGARIQRDFLVRQLRPGE